MIHNIIFCLNNNKNKKSKWLCLEPKEYDAFHTAIVHFSETFISFCFVFLSFIFLFLRDHFFQVLLITSISASLFLLLFWVVFTLLLHAVLHYFFPHALPFWDFVRSRDIYTWNIRIIQVSPEARDRAFSFSITFPLPAFLLIFP